MHSMLLAITAPAGFVITALWARWILRSPGHPVAALWRAMTLTHVLRAAAWSAALLIATWLMVRFAPWLNWGWLMNPAGNVRPDRLPPFQSFLAVMAALSPLLVCALPRALTLSPLEVLNVDRLAGWTVPLHAVPILGLSVAAGMPVFSMALVAVVPPAVRLLAWRAVSRTPGRVPLDVRAGVQDLVGSGRRHGSADPDRAAVADRVRDALLPTERQAMTESTLVLYLVTVMLLLIVAPIVAAL